MLKTILKMAYIALAIVIGAIVGYGSYTINLQESASNAVKNAIKDKDYTTLSRIYSGGLIDSTNLAKDFTKTDKYDIFMNSGVYEYSGTYKEVIENEEDVATELKTTYYHEFERTYYIYLTDVNFLFADSVGAGGKTVHHAGIKFNGTDSSYEYYYDLNDDSNASVKDTDYKVIKVENTKTTFEYDLYANDYTGYVKTPYSEKELLLNSQRKLTNFYVNYGFLPVSFTEGQINAIKDLLGSEIVSFNIMDASGTNVSGDINFQFTFEEDFFNEASSLFDAYSKFLPIYDKYGNVDGAKYESDVSESEYRVALETFNKSVEEFAYKLNNKALFNNLETFYSPLPDSFIKSNDLVGKTILICAIYVVAAIVLYFLLFHIKDITNLIYRRGNKNTNRGYSPKTVPTVNNTKKESDDTSNVIEVKEENKEE